jgi:hypothetical protein
VEWVMRDARKDFCDATGMPTWFVVDASLLQSSVSPDAYMNLPAFSPSSSVPRAIPVYFLNAFLVGCSDDLDEYDRTPSSHTTH